MKALTFGVALLFLVVARPAAQAPTILFVCEHGAAKSVVAAAHFNKRAAEAGLPFRAVSRGTAPDPSVPARIADGLKSEGLAVPPGFVPAAVQAGDINRATRIVTFDVVLPTPTDAARSSTWDGLPAFSDGYGPASAAILTRVDALIRDLQISQKKR